ncbi:MAG: putative toxin-antitoxin system toxin component, PIN family [Deltaproteobacteria bacterium]|jgi:putative PIN family toxin of toxin-antitoxin system|nr:putative toxin-antitoxin system toxin component, PIN family [Deltaproteobacteria bacterium]
MRVMADTNIYISTLLFPASLPAKVLLHIADKHELVLCDHIVAEIRDVVAWKRPDLLADVDVLLAQLSYEMVIAPKEPSKLISDPKDQPILNAAIMAGVDAIVSGDKHFLKLDMDSPKPMSVADFWQLEQE